MADIGFLNGQFVDASSISIPPYDAGFLMGITIAEQIRTFNGRPFWVKQHLQRLFEGLDLANIKSPVARATLHDAVYRVVNENYGEAANVGADLGVTIFVTPGPYAAYGIDGEPVAAVHSYRLQTQMWADRYVNGQRAIISSYREIPNDCWPTKIKCRSRMHYYMASQEARSRDAGLTPILLDHDGCLAETPIASLLLYSKDRGFSSPLTSKTLPGISLAYVRQLASQLGIPFEHRDLTVDELKSSDEVLLTSTPFAVLPVVEVDGQAIGSGQPGAIFERLLKGWNQDVGVDICNQANRV